MPQGEPFRYRGDKRESFSASMQRVSHNACRLPLSGLPTEFFEVALGEMLRDRSSANARSAAGEPIAVRRALGIQSPAKILDQVPRHTFPHDCRTKHGL